MRLAIAVALVVALALAVWWVRRPLVMMRQVGLRGWLPETGRRCEAPAGTPWRHCYGTTEAPGGAREEDRVSLDRRTGRITELERMWQVSDSVEVMREEDSIAAAMRRHGGRAIECPTPTSTGSAQRIAAWRFPEQDVRVIRSRWTGPKLERPAWMLQVSGFPVGDSGCQPASRAQRLLTPREMLEGIQRWLFEQLDQVQFVAPPPDDR